MALIDTDQLEREQDQAYLDEMRFELRKSLRREVIEWGKRHRTLFFFAVYSATKGAWDDVKRDLQKHRISFDEANQIVEKFFDFGMISERQCTSYKEHFLEELNKMDEALNRTKGGN